METCGQFEVLLLNEKVFSEKKNQKTGSREEGGCTVGNFKKYLNLTTTSQLKY